jgi:glycosyltransferase involved in cell wall biosynthesis
MKPFMSVIVISYNMNRELPRTIYSLSTNFQRDISRDEYEVILVDNGSKIPPQLEDFSDLDIDLTVYHHENPTHSPVDAINMAINKASGQFIGVCIDGARILSPRVLATAREGLSMSDRSVVAVRGRYLGSELQRHSIAKGYDRALEDKLLSASGWQTNGYRLFDVSVFDESSGATWFDPIAESNALFMGRSLWHEINGFDPRFKSPGGGLVNLDTWKRAVELPDVNPMILIGEATFHQVHGGVATNGSHETIRTFFDEYVRIHNKEFITPKMSVSLFGKNHDGFDPSEGFFAQDDGSKSAKNRSRRLRTAVSKTIGSKLSATSRRKFRVLYDLLEAVVSRNPLVGIRQLRWENSQAEILETHPFFDSEWYEMTYPYVVAAGYKPSLHYVRHGARQRTLPGPIFDAVWYLDRNTDVRNSGENPLIHYLTFGEIEGRRIRVGPQSFGTYERFDEQELLQILTSSTLFDPDWYVAQYPDVLISKLDPAIHYLRFGTLLGRNPSKDFDGVHYRHENPDVQRSGINPLVHFESLGRGEGRSYQPVSK